ncbi:MAG: hypothetical protein HYZ47_04405, partial [Simkania negevensis]|nr:hypothetical protein [Simkania negevensis]
MQFFAYKGDKILFPEEALKGESYSCPQCGDILRVKEGFYRRKHFFHFHPSTCQMRKKRKEHIEIQKWLTTLLPKGRVILEKRFPSISRIADLYWADQKIIFEIQCSPISMQEVRNRSRDYKSLGLHLVWILDEREFNKKNLSAGEEEMRKEPSYYVSPSRKLLYDQFEIFHGPRRLFKATPLPIQIESPQEIFSLPSFLKGKKERGKLFFLGDLI